jgi:glycosyltransferase involved in cell wall biosynthesis
MNGVMSVGRPVIVGADRDSEIVRVAEASGGGIVVDPGRPDLLAREIRHAYEGRYDLEAMGRSGREWVAREIDRSVSIDRYRALLDELVA